MRQIQQDKQEDVQLNIDIKHKQEKQQHHVAAVTTRTNDLNKNNLNNLIGSLITKPDIWFVKQNENDISNYVHN